MLISKSKSYIFLLNQNKSLFDRLKHKALHENFRVASFSSEEELIKALGEARSILAVVTPDSSTSLFIDQLKSLKSKMNFIVLNTNHNTDEPSLMLELDKGLAELFPSGLKTLVVSSCEYIFKNFIGSTEVKFAVTNGKMTLKNPDIAVFCDMLGEKICCQIFIYCDRSNLKRVSAKLADEDFEGVAAYLREFCNQVLGAVNFNLQRINVSSKVGLPASFPLGDDNTFGQSYYIPKIRMVDSEISLEIAIGLFSLENMNKLPNFELDFQESGSSEYF